MANIRVAADYRPPYYVSTEDMTHRLHDAMSEAGVPANCWGVTFTARQTIFDVGLPDYAYVPAGKSELRRFVNASCGPVHTDIKITR